MEIKILISTLEEELRYVAEVDPLKWTAYVTEAKSFKYEEDSELLEADAIEAITEIAKDLGALRFKVHIFDETDFNVANLLVSYPTVHVEISKKAPSGTSAIVHNIVEHLHGTLIDLSLELDMFKLLKDTESKKEAGPAMSKTDPTKTAPDKDIEGLIEYISNKTKATVVKPKETLANYVCNDLLKEELTEIVDFFKNAETYRNANIEIPKGILFKGLPGTGKTYAAKCIAGTTDAYFLTCTASALQGMYIGSGAENIRNLFKAAKELQERSKKGVIIFIDELDSLGSRESHSHSSSGEEDRTLNQLLAEMSGFEDVEGIMLLAATNYPERIDDALMRSGRFSRQINIEYPEYEERKHLVDYYFGQLNIPLEEDATIPNITNLTDGLSPADIKEISNEAAIMAIRYKQVEIKIDYINEAINKVITKNIRKPDSPDVDYKLIAAHECGHVLAEYLYDKSIPIKVTNYSYGNAGGFTQSASRLEGILPKEQFLNRVKTLLAGRAAEYVICHTITNGASNDLYKAKNIMRAYYEDYQFESYESEKLNQLIIDKIQELYNDVVETFRKTDNCEMLNDLTNELIAKRVLYEQDIKIILTKEEDIL